MTDDIAALIERARGYPEGSFTELIDALRTLAQENARLDDIAEATKALLEVREQRIAELEKELRDGH